VTESIRWPPPGLERLQGDLVRVATRAALGGGILVAPLLFVLGRRLDFATLGPFADAWWVSVVLAIAGLTFAADALVRTMTLLRRVSKALEQGYDLHTLLMVVSDRDRDMGFLLTGGRHFAEMDTKEREAVGQIRVFSAVLYAAAGIWLPNALALGILLGARGWVTPTGLWMGTVLPSAALYLFALVAGTVGETRVRRARKRWYRQEWVSDLASEEAAAWRGKATPTGEPPRKAAQDRALGRALRYTSVLMGTLAALIAIPILTLVPTAAVGPILTQLAVPGFDDVRARSARVEALRTYRVIADPSVEPEEAGRLLHDVVYAGSDHEAPLGERGPGRRIAERWLVDAVEDNPIGVPPSDWPDSLFTVVARGLAPAQSAYLEGLTSHPARADFSRLAHAAAIDVAGARWQDPLPAELTLVDMPLPRFAELRDAAYSHVGAAAAAFVAGRPDRAEELVREVLSLGFLLGDGGPTLIDNVIGYALAEQGGQALADLYLVTGNEEGAARLSALKAAAEGAASRARFRYPEGAEAWLRSLPDMVADTSVARGLRWEVFIGITTLTPCVNLQRLVFGPDPSYWNFVEAAHDQLVAWPSEEGLFERARAGWFGSRADAPGTLVGRILSISMRTGEGTCGEVVRQLEAAEALF
jgi:hypothetical protein